MTKHLQLSPTPHGQEGAHPDDRLADRDPHGDPGQVLPAVQVDIHRAEQGQQNAELPGTAKKSQKSRWKKQKLVGKNMVLKF